jgi:hypothetical protein
MHPTMVYWWLLIYDKGETSTSHPILKQVSVGSRLNWSAREKEFYGIYYDVKLFEDLLKTDHMNLTYINVTFTGKVLRWKMYLQDKDFNLYHVAGKEEHQCVPDALAIMC